MSYTGGSTSNEETEVERIVHAIVSNAIEISVTKEKEKKKQKEMERRERWRNQRREECEEDGKKMCRACCHSLSMDKFRVGEAIRALCASCREKQKLQYEAKKRSEKGSKKGSEKESEKRKRQLEAKRKQAEEEGKKFCPHCNTALEVKAFEVNRTIRSVCKACAFKQGNNIKYTIRNIRTNAEKRGIQVLMTDEEIEDDIRQPCDYCGFLPDKGFNGLDRLDSMDCYRPGNVVPCCWFCNRAKFTMDPVSYLERCAAVVHHATKMGLMEKFQEMNIPKCGEVTKIPRMKIDAPETSTSPSPLGIPPASVFQITPSLTSTLPSRAPPIETHV